MNVKIVLFVFFSILLTSCGSDSSAPITVSQTDLKNLSYENATLKVEIETDLEWTATSLANWCKVSQKKGTGATTLELQLEANIDKVRSTEVVVRTSEGTVRIEIQQNAMPAGQVYEYKMPVIFHVLYKDRTDNKQYVPQTRLREILSYVNELYAGHTLYKGSDAGVNMNVEFVLAEKDEAGNVLETPGVEYVKVDAMPMDCEAFMSGSRYVNLLWDPNSYINVMLYNFASVDNGIILGISHMPLSVAGSNYLEGLSSTNYTYLTKDNLNYPMCVSINSLYVYEDYGNNGGYNGSNVKVTLAHELGHYLGLHHAFDEADNGELSTKCINSDYCDDTPSYNRVAYMYNLSALLQEAAQAGVAWSMEEAVKRENCKTGKTFSSYNIMDYEVSYGDRFTQNQLSRIRHVLTYSPLIPGPKKGLTATRSAVAGVLDLPMVIKK